MLHAQAVDPQRRAEALAKVSLTFSRHITDESCLLATIAREVATLTGDGCAIRLFDEAGTTLRTATLHHADPERLAHVVEDDRPFTRAKMPEVFAAVYDRQETLVVRPREAQSPIPDDLRRQTAELGVLMSIVTPLVAQGVVMGVLVVARLGERPFESADEDFVRDVALRAALALHNARLLVAASADRASLLQSTDRLALLSVVARELMAASADPAAVLQAVADRLTAILGDGCIIRPISGDYQTLLRARSAWAGDSSHQDLFQELLSPTLQLGEGIMGHVAGTKTSTRVDRLSPSELPGPLSEATQRRLTALDVRSLLAVPLLGKGQIVGVLCLLRVGRDQPYTSDEQSFVEEVAAFAAFALSNGRLLLDARRDTEALRVNTERLTLLSTISRELMANSVDTSSALAVVAQRLTELLGDGCVLRLVDEQSQALMGPTAAWVADPGQRERAQALLAPQIPMNIGALGYVARTGKPIRIESVTEEPVPGRLSDEARRAFAVIPVHSLLAVPLTTAGRVLGVLALVRTSPDRPYTAEEQRLVEDVAGYAAIAVANGNLLAAARREAQIREQMAARLQLLSNLAQEFAAATPNVDQLLGLLTRRLAEVVGDGCMVRLVAPDRQTLLPCAALWTLDEAHMPAARAALSTAIPMGVSIPGTVAATGTSIRIDDFAAITPPPGTTPQAVAIAQETHIRGLLAVPLKVQDLTQGVLILTRTGTSRPYSDADQRFVEDVAVYAALALANGRLLADAERSAHQSRVQEARYRAVLERNSDCTTLVDREGRIVFVSPAAQIIHGHEPKDMVGQHAEILVHPDDVASLNAQVGSIFVDPSKPAVARYRTRPNNGEVRWLEATVINLLDDPAVQAIVGNAHDITERERALRELRVSENRFLGLSESGLLGIFVANRKGAVVEANDTFLALVGYSREDIAAGQITWDEIIPPEGQALHAEVMAQLANEGKARSIQKEYRRKDGTRVPVLLGAAIADDQGSILCFISDLTERRHFESALKESEHQLRQAQKMEAIGRLAGGVAHDFNNLLSVILSLAELVMRDLPAGDPLREDLEEIRKAGQRGAELTRQLLLFSRHQASAPVPLDINALLEGLNKMIPRLLGEDVDFALRLGSDIGKVVADPGQIEQTIVNLVVNARDAMPTGGRLTIETHAVVLDQTYASEHLGTKAGPHVLVTVTDSGIGMNKETLRRIFEPFFTTKPPGKGTGLGLSTVFWIVQQHGGSVWVYSEPGLGSTFKVYLPSMEGTVAPQVTPKSAPPRLTHGTETVLLVEDEDAVRQVAESILKRCGYTVISASNASEAIYRCATYGAVIHLLLTDVVMPMVSGPELARRLHGMRPDMKLLCMSGYTDDSIVRHGLIDSGIPFLEKPLTPDALARKVREVLDAPVRS